MMRAEYRTRVKGRFQAGGERRLAEVWKATCVP